MITTPIQGEEGSVVTGRGTRLVRRGLDALSMAAPVLVLVILALILAYFRPSFLSLYSLSVLAGESSVIMLLATGQTLVILLGGIDLSMAALASLSSVIIAIWLPPAGVFGIAGALLLTTTIGAAQGYIHAKGQIPSFVVTLAGLGLWSGVALLISHAGVPVPRDAYQVVGWLHRSVLHVPAAFLFSAAGLLGALWAVRVLPFGRYLRAIGMGESAALLSGTPVVRVKVIAFAIAGVFSGLAGVLIVARTHTGHPTIAQNLLLPSIAAVVVGGTAITGGFGGLGRTFAGVLIVTILRVGIAVVGVDPGYEPLAYGVLVVAAVAFTIDRSKTGIVK